MYIFTIALTLYGIIHFYIFLKIKSVFLISPGMSVLTCLFFFFMTMSPFFVHLCALRASLTPSRIFGNAVYIWMAIVLFFFSAALPMDLYNFSVNSIAFILQKNLNNLILNPFSLFFIPLFLSFVFTTYGYFEAKDLRTERLVVKTSKLPQGTGKLTIAHITDLHLGLLVREHILNKVVKIIEDEKPDIIVSTGDLIDMDINHIDAFADTLKKMYAPLGKFASAGNHEFFVGIKKSRQFIEKSGFIFLRNSVVTPHNLIHIAGIDDRLGKYVKKYQDTVSASEEEILSGLAPDKFTVLLKHRPEINRNSIGLYDLQLSGHTHKGQLFPVNLFIKYFLYPHYSGYTKFYKGTAMYVSRGAGTTCCPVRFFAPPEITIIELVPESSLQ